MRMWFNGRTPASQAGNGGSIPLIRSILSHNQVDIDRIVENQNFFNICLDDAFLLVRAFIFYITVFHNIVVHLLVC